MNRASALAAMKDLESKLARLEIHADGFTEVTVDGSKIEETTVYVSPGEHLVEGKIKKKTASARPRAEAHAPRQRAGGGDPGGDRALGDLHGAVRQPGRPPAGPGRPQDHAQDGASEDEARSSRKIAPLGRLSRSRAEI